MHELASRADVRGGFVHVPFEPGQLPEGSADPSLAVTLMAEAIAAVVRTSLTRAADVALAAGSIQARGFHEAAFLGACLNRERVL